MSSYPTPSKKNRVFECIALIQNIKVARSGNLIELPFSFIFSHPGMIISDNFLRFTQLHGFDVHPTIWIIKMLQNNTDNKLYYFQLRTYHFWENNKLFKRICRGKNVLFTHKMHFLMKNKRSLNSFITISTFSQKKEVQ